MTAPIKTMSRANCEIISATARTALEMVAEQYGLTLKQERGTYDPGAGTMTSKWTFVCEGEDGIPADFNEYAPLYGMSAADYGRTFTTLNGSFTICGISPRSRKYPILAKCEATGKTYKFTERAVAAV